MNNDKRLIAFVSLGLLVAALLVPFFLALCGRGDLAVGFAIVAGLLALLFGALSWSDRIGKTVTTVLLLMLVGGVAGMAVLFAVRTLRTKGADQPNAGMERARPEAAPRHAQTPQITP